MNVVVLYFGWFVYLCVYVCLGGCFAVQRKDSEHTGSSEEQENVSTTIVSDDPHAVLVEFSSVVADTQEYIIGVSYLTLRVIVSYEWQN